MSNDKPLRPSLLLFPLSGDPKPTDIVGMLGWLMMPREAVEAAEGMIGGTVSQLSKVTPAIGVTEIAFGSNGFVVGMDGAPAVTRSLEGPALFRFTVPVPMTTIEFAALFGPVPRVEAHERLRDLVLICLALCGVDPRREKNKSGLQAAYGLRQQIAEALAEELIAWHNAKKEG